MRTKLPRQLAKGDQLTSSTIAGRPLPPLLVDEAVQLRDEVWLSFADGSDVVIDRLDVPVEVSA